MSQVSSLNESQVSALNSLGAYYTAATTDHSYKELAWHVKGASNLIVNCLLRLQFPHADLDIRDVKIGGEHVDANRKDFWSAVSSYIDGAEQALNKMGNDLEKARSSLEGDYSNLKGVYEKLKNVLKICNPLKELLQNIENFEKDIAEIKKIEGRLQELGNLVSGLKKVLVQNLKTDSLFKTGIGDSYAWIVVEMQVKKQEMAIRLLSYVCKVFALENINLPKEIIPYPVYGFALCLAKSDSLQKNGVLDTRWVDEDPKQCSAISTCNVYLNEPQKYLLGEKRQTELKKQQEIWKKKVFNWFANNNGSNLPGQGPSLGKFEDMPIDRKKVYSFIEMITLSTLMSPKDVEEALSYLPDEDQDKEVFKRIYESLRIKEERMEKVKFDEKYPNLWEILEKNMAQKNVELEAENAALKAKSTALEAEGIIKNLIVNCIVGKKGKLLDTEIEPSVPDKEIRKRAVDEVVKSFKGKVVRLDGNRDICITL